MSRRTAKIIVPTFGQETFTVRCFDSLLACTTAYRLVWVDNASSPSSRAAVFAHFQRHPDRLAIWPEQNLGFIGGTNLGLSAVLADTASEAEYIVLLNNDTELTPHWLERLLAVLKRNPSLGAVGPSCTAPSEAADTYDDVPMVPFFCTAFPKRVFREVGLLDPRFGMGLADDDDYCHRLRRAGYRVAVVPGVSVLHNERTTFRSLYSDAEIAAMQAENLARFRRKHSLG